MSESNSIKYAYKQSSKKARLCVVLLVLLTPSFAKAQRQRVYTNVFWVGYNNRLQFADKFTLNSEVQVRTRGWTSEIAQEAAILGVSYKPSAKLGFSAGGGWFRQAQLFADKTIHRIEWRPYQDVSYHFREGKLSVQQRLRLEERFLQQIVGGQKTSRYDYLTRLRYRLELQLPLKENRFVPTIGNETMIYPALLGRDRFLDQTRTYIGVNTRLTSSTMLQLQYMKTFQLRINNRLEDQNAVRLYLYQQFNLRK